MLKGLPGLEEMTATAFAGSASIKLSFKLNANMDQALIEVMGRLSRVRKKPVDALPPVIDTSTPSDSLVFMFVQYQGQDGLNIDMFEEEIKTQIIPYLEDVEGVSTSELYLSSDRQIEINVDNSKMAHYGFQLSDIISQLRWMKNASGGFIPISNKQFSLRYQGQQTPDDISNIIIKEDNGRFIRLHDVAQVVETRGAKRHFVIQNGNSAVGIKLMRSQGASVLTTLLKVKQVIDTINADIADKKLKVELSFDPSVFITRAVIFVSSNLTAGIFLAVLMLFYFLRHAQLSLLIALTIPLSFLANFIVFNLMGRTLNVISLAGLAFASGLILDAGIVVLESIQRYIRKGKAVQEAIIEGTLQVKSALIASTATTLIVFFPIFTLEDVEGQLFADLAIAIVICVCVSLVLSLTLLPTLCRYVLRNNEASSVNTTTNRLETLVEKINCLTNSRKNQIWVITSIVAISTISMVLLLPKVDYMPAVKRDALDTIMKFPSAANMDYIEHDIAQPIVKRLAPYLSGEKTPKLKNYYIVVSPGYSSLAVRTENPAQLPAFKKVIEEEILTDLPSTSGFVMQGSLFGSFNSTRSLKLNVYAEDLAQLVSSAMQMSQEIKRLGDGYNVTITPRPDELVVEYRIIPDLEHISEAGLSLQEIAHITQSLGEGVYVSEQFDGKRNVNLIVKSNLGQIGVNAEHLTNMPISTKNSGIVPLSQLVHIEEVSVPKRIQRIDQKKSITLTVYPPEEASLTELAKQITNMKNVIDLAPETSIKLSNSSDKLNNALSTLSQAFALALVLLLILLLILFSNIVDAVLVTLILPFACIGGIWSLAFANLFTPINLDLLTFMGFIILLGLVVNNAILLVDHCRKEQDKGVSLNQAVASALQARIRPIVLTSITSVVGMLPLAVFPGPGSEIYRGLAIVIAGGMTVSTVFSVILLPCLLKISLSRSKNRSQSSSILYNRKEVSNEA